MDNTESIPSRGPERPDLEYNWLLSQPDLVNRYAGQVVILYNRTILGAGWTDLEALENAKQQAAEQKQPLPDRCDFFFASVPRPEHLWFVGEFYDPQP